MLGERIIARSLQSPRVKDSAGRLWQYHSRSDRHSKIACWAIMFDLLRHCPLLRSHVAANKVGYGINHEMRDYGVNRKKNLDLVVCGSKGVDPASPVFGDDGESIGVVLTAGEKDALAALPVLRGAALTSVLLALEAKACMTEHVKARPRLYDELASSFATIHGDTSSAIAAAFVMINCAETFVSPGRNKGAPKKADVEVSEHRQPDVALKVLEKVMELKRRTGEKDNGFDAIGVTMIDCRNDGSPVTIADGMNQRIAAILRYEELVQRLALLYATKFAGI